MTRQITHLPLHFFDNNKTGALVSRIMSDVEGVRNLVGTGLVQLVGGILTAGVAIFLLININAKMTLFAFVPLVVYALGRIVFTARPKQRRFISLPFRSSTAAAMLAEPSDED